jgi:hypothetical protein
MSDVTEPTLPGMPDLPPLWAVHVQGSDDILAMPSRDEAQVFVELLDKLDAEKAGREHMPKYSAVICEWPFAREEHAVALVEQDETF